MGGPNLPPARLSYGGCVWRIGDPRFFLFLFLMSYALFGGRCMEVVCGKVGGVCDPCGVDGTVVWLMRMMIRWDEPCCFVEWGEGGVIDLKV